LPRRGYAARVHGDFVAACRVEARNALWGIFIAMIDFRLKVSNLRGLCAWGFRISRLSSLSFARQAHEQADKL
jgi:hypothetical protein